VGRGSVSALVCNSISSIVFLVAAKEFLPEDSTSFFLPDSLGKSTLLGSSFGIGRSDNPDAITFSCSFEASAWGFSKCAIPPVAPDSNSLSGANTASHQSELTLCDAILYHFIQYLHYNLFIIYMAIKMTIVSTSLYTIPQVLHLLAGFSNLGLKNWRI
jgi:hypothetical protein